MEQPQCQRVSSHPTLVLLFVSFLKLGMTAFGGPAMVAYIRKMAVEQKKWLDEASFRNGVALCQSLPGATAMMTSAYVGLRARGVLGAAVSFIGFGLPAFCLMIILSILYVQTQSQPVAVSAFSGLRAIIVAIIANATISFGKSSLKSWRDIVIACVASTMFGLGVKPVLVILLAALLGVILYRRQSLLRGVTDSVTTMSTARPFALLVLVTTIGFVLLFIANRRFFDLSVLVFKISLLAFGGGFTAVPLMLHEFVSVRSLMDSTTFMDGIVMGQITPGPIVITATFIGYWLYGLPGGLVATVTVFLPSFLLVVGIVPYYDRLRKLVYFNRAIAGILPSFVGLLLSVNIRFALNVPWNLYHAFFACVALVALLLKVEIFWVVLIGIVISILIL